MAVAAVPGAEPAVEKDQAAILEVVGPRIELELGKRAFLSVRTLRREEDWAFLVAAMQDPHGRPISYIGTSRAEAAAQGFVSKDYVALLRREDGRWRIVTDAIGPTDMVWAPWAQDHGAPETLFAL